jgi:hypothetical protein
MMRMMKKKKTIMIRIENIGSSATSTGSDFPLKILTFQGGAINGSNFFDSISERSAFGSTQG